MGFALFSVSTIVRPLTAGFFLPPSENGANKTAGNRNTLGRGTKQKMLLAALFAASNASFLTAMSTNSLHLFDFSSSLDWSGWAIQNDVVMGGESSSDLSRSNEGNAVFTGDVSLSNNGGFASLHYQFMPKDIRGYESAVIHLKGDGKQYQFRIKAGLNERASYIHTFNTSGEWQTIEIPLNKMEPSYRGNKLDQPNFNANQMQEVRFLIGNGKAENFRLEIDKLALQG